MTARANDITTAAATSFESKQIDDAARSTEGQALPPRFDDQAIPSSSGTNATALSLGARYKRGWGPKYEPPVADEDGRTRFRRLCDDLAAYVQQVDQFLADGVVADDGAGIVAEIQASLEQLYRCPFGLGESLKSVVVAIQSQVNNAIWTDRHVAFLKAVTRFLRRRYVVSKQTADEVFDMIEEYGLDPFRGSVSDTGVRVRYRLERVQDQ